jgi:hypothetical protein
MTLDAARAELAGLINDVAGATARAYDVVDDLNRSMGPTDVLWVPEANSFAAAYFTYDSDNVTSHVQIATSVDLATWTWRTSLASRASQPAIAAGPNGTYLVAWEQEPDPIHIVMEEFTTWADLLAARPVRHFDVPITTRACGEGTPSFESVTTERVQLGFHYHGGCERDREAYGWTDWTSWRSQLRPELDQALIDQGIDGHIGDRDSITYGGQAFQIVEGQGTLDDFGSWRLFLYDAWSGTATPLDVRAGGSVSIANPSLELADVHGHAALIVSLYVMESPRLGEEGTLIYYRYLDDI